MKFVDLASEIRQVPQEALQLMQADARQHKTMNAFCMYESAKPKVTVFDKV
jgi:hypothetical protein